MSLSLELAARLDSPADVASSALDMGHAAFEYWLRNPDKLPDDNAVRTSFVSCHRNTVNTLAVNISHIMQVSENQGLRIPAQLRRKIRSPLGESFTQVASQHEGQLIPRMRDLYEDLLACLAEGSRKVNE